MVEQWAGGEIGSGEVCIKMFVISACLEKAGNSSALREVEKTGKNSNQSRTERLNMCGKKSSSRTGRNLVLLLKHKLEQSLRE